MSLRAWLAGMSQVEEGDWPDTNEQLHEFMGEPVPKNYAALVAYRARFDARVKAIKAAALIAELENP